MLIFSCTSVFAQAAYDIHGDVADQMLTSYSVARILQKFDKLEYRGDWNAQVIRAEIVGAPGHGVPIALFEAVDGEMA